MSFVSQSRTARGSFRIPLAVAEAFPLFSPRGEERWAPGWKPEMLYTPGGDWSEELVWRTHDGSRAIIWFVAQLDRERHRVRYHRVDGQEMAVTVEVACSATGDGGTEVSVRYTWVGLSDEGNELATSVSDASFAERMREWQGLVTAAARE